MQGGPGNDTLFGFEGRDYIRGGSGDDIIVGGNGIDDTNGNTGNDHIIRYGADTTNGGYGIDRCESEVLPNREELRSCERLGAPTLDYAPPAYYTQIHDYYT